MGCGFVYDIQVTGGCTSAFVESGGVTLARSRLQGGRRGVCDRRGGNTWCRGKWRMGAGDYAVGRLGEFSSSEGDENLQNQLAKEVMWQARKIASEEHMDLVVNFEMLKAKNVLSEMYIKSERDIMASHEDIVLRLSLDDITKWNQHVQEGYRTSKARRSEISAELAIVHRLLKAATKKARRPSKADGRTQLARSASKDEDTNTTGGRFRNFAVIMMSILTSAAGIGVFETISKQENGPQNLVKFALWSGLPLVIAAHFAAMKSIATAAQSDLDQGTPPKR